MTRTLTMLTVLALAVAFRRLIARLRKPESAASTRGAA